MMINAFLHNVNEDVLFLSKVPPIQGTIRAREGQEMVRVDSDGVNVKIITRSQMQNKSDRDYFIKARPI